MDQLLSIPTAVLILAIVQLAALGTGLLYAYYNRTGSQDIDTAYIDGFLDTLDESVGKLKENQLELFEFDQKIDVRATTLESKFAELHEYVTRGIKRMATRNARAEQLNALNEDLAELEEAGQEQNQLDFFEDPNQRPRLVRNGR
jgi:hypothetical protein